MIQAYKNYKISNNLCRNTKEKKFRLHVGVHFNNKVWNSDEFPNNAKLHNTLYLRHMSLLKNIVTESIAYIN